MHERNAHNFPLDLASGEVLPVAFTAPLIIIRLFQILLSKKKLKFKTYQIRD